MVNNASRSMLLLVFLLPSWCMAGLSVSLDKKTTVLGEPLVLEIQADRGSEPLNSISLEKLKQDFNVYSISGSTQEKITRGKRMKRETLSLILYPLHLGNLVLPALSYQRQNSRPLSVSVLESSAQTPQVRFRTALDMQQMQVRQAAMLTLEIIDDGRMQWTVPRELSVENAHQRKLSDSQREETLDGVRYTVHRYSWALMPLKEGNLKVAFPMLDAFKFGTRLRYPVAPLLYKAAAVPAYLPVHVPIGKPILSAAKLPEEIALDRPYNWQISVQGSGVSAEGLSKLLSSVQSNEALHFYPLKISQDDRGRAASASQSLLVTLPFIALKTGKLTMPEIRVPYHDPVSGRLEAVLIEGVEVEAYSPFWRVVQNILWVLMVLLVSAMTGYGLFKLVQGRRQRSKVLARIGAANNAEELQQALLAFDTGAMPVQTLQSWMLFMQQHHEVDGRLEILVSKLLDVHYGAGPAERDIGALVSLALQILGKLPLLKFYRGKIIQDSGLIQIVPRRLLLNFLFNPKAAKAQRTLK